MNIEHLMSRRRLIAFLVFSGCASTGMLSVALSIVVLRPPLVCLVPDLSESSVVRAGKVPDASARAFAMLYVMRLDNYTPATAEVLSEHLQAWVAPCYWGRAVPALQRRSRLAREGRLSSQVIIPDEKAVVIDRNGDQIQVVVPALRRHFVSGAPGSPIQVLYKLRLEISAPGETNPHGLVVAEQKIEEVLREDSDRPGPAVSFSRGSRGRTGDTRKEDPERKNRPF